MSSKQVVDRQKSADAIIAVGETQAAAAGAAINHLCKPYLAKHEEAPDVALALVLLTRVLRAKKDAMVRADDAHHAELGDDDEIRKSRDDAAQKLYDKLVELREIVGGVYGAETAGKIFSGSTPLDPVFLGRFAEASAAALERVKLPAPRIKGAKLDVAETVDGIRGAAATLDSYVQDVAREVREAQATLDAKNKAIAAYDEAFSGIAAMLSGALRCAGKDELAAKVRPSTRRPGQTASDIGEDASPEAAPKAAPPVPA